MAEKKTFLVFWKDAKKLVIEKTTQDIEKMKRDFKLMFLKKDSDGNEHYKIE